MEKQWKKRPWNKGKKKPITDESGLTWCNCDFPKLIKSIECRGQALCLLCNTPWYH